jgi:hypothetical protein
VLAGVGAVGFVFGLLAAPSSAWAQLLLVGFLGVGFGLAGTLLIALQFVTGAGWSVALRRVAEAMTALLLPAAALVLLALVAAPQLYPWTSGERPPYGPFKDAWLSRPFFLARAVAYVLIWAALARALVRASRRQDADGAVVHTRTMTRLSALFLVVFGVTFWLASYDWLMSREPQWASTVYGLYNFAGLFSGGLAAFIFLVLWLAHLGPFRFVLTEQHRHDLGKLLFAMTTFWAYLWYCQYMLIWYVDNPEETPHYVARLQGALQPLFWANVVLNWVVPFFALMTRSTKRSPKVLAHVCIVVLVGRWLDLDLLILPPGDGLVAVLLPLPLTAGSLALYFLILGRALGRAALIPVRDPYLVESLPGSHRAVSVLEEVKS